MAWTDDLVLMTRVLLNDLTEPHKQGDAQLRRTIICAGILVNKDVTLSCAYSFDITNLTITPDPVASGDTVAQALFPLKAACIVNQGQFQQALGQGIKVRDGDSMVDTSVSFRGYRDILEHGACAAYERLRWQVQASAASAVGAVLGPNRAPGEWASDTIAWFYDGLATSLSQHRRRTR